jgi:uncharacterized protein (DUF362 family)
MVERVTRREFIKKALGMAIAGGTMAASPKILAEERVSELVIARGDSPARTVRAAIEALGGMSRFVKPKTTVLLKPNISFPNSPNWATTTDPEVVRTLAEMCLKAGARRVIIADHPLCDPRRCLERTGISKACADMKGVHVKLLTEERDYRKAEVKGRELKSVEIARLVLKADVIINVPVAKSHSATGVSFSMKNLMGLIWDRVSFHKGDLHRAIAELSLLIKPRLIVLDATRILLTKGPEGPGRVEEMRSVIVGTDPVAVDSYATTMAGWNGRRLSPDQIPYISHAAELKIGEMDLDAIKIREVKA